MTHSLKPKSLHFNEMKKDTNPLTPQESYASAYFAFSSSLSAMTNSRNATPSLTNAIKRMTSEPFRIEPHSSENSSALPPPPRLSQAPERIANSSFRRNGVDAVIKAYLRAA